MTSLHWLLQEPVVLGTRIRMSAQTFPGMREKLPTSGTLILKDIVSLAEVELINVMAVTSRLNAKSLRYVNKFLGALWDILKQDEREHF